MDSGTDLSDGMDGAAIRLLFGELDELLHSDPVPEHTSVVVAGGAAMAMTLVPDLLTGDVDAVSEGLTSRVRNAVAEVSRNHRGLRADWLNDGPQLRHPPHGP